MYFVQKWGKYFTLVVDEMKARAQSWGDNCGGSDQKGHHYDSYQPCAHFYTELNTENKLFHISQEPSGLSCCHIFTTQLSDVTIKTHGSALSLLKIRSHHGHVSFPRFLPSLLLPSPTADWSAESPAPGSKPSCCLFIAVCSEQLHL